MREHQHNIFSVPVWGYILNEHKYQSIDYIECCERIESTEPKVIKSNFGGFQSRDNLCDTEPVFKEWITLVEGIGNNIVNQISGNKAEKLKMTELWCNVNYKNSCNGSHIHSGILSGVFYLKTPENCGNLVFVNPAVRSDAHLIRMSNYPVLPENLALLFFPSWLEHYVEPNLSNEKRISLSFNLDVKK